jgi:hypothetical protein
MKLWPSRTVSALSDSVPGPSPWYLKSPAATLSGPGGPWSWVADSQHPGLCRLLSPRQQPVLIVGFHCYVKSLPEGRAMIWHESGRHPTATNSIPKIVFHLVRLSSLAPLADVDVISAEMKSREEPLRYVDGDVTPFELVTSLPEGSHRILAPAAFQDLPEILVLADFGPPETSSNHWDRMARAIFAFDFNGGHVHVLPQTWFNEGGYDYGYQWIARVDRDPKSGRIVGEGVRLGPFRLDSSGQRVEEWL